jgi:hypothetical protein
VHQSAKYIFEPMALNLDPKKVDQERIRGLLVKAGDDRKKVVGNIRGLLSVLGEDMAEHRETILLSFVECAKYLPTKSGVLATWLSLMNPSHRVFVSDAINALYGELRYAVEKHDYQVTSCILRVMIELTNCGSLSLESVVALCNSILDYPTEFSIHVVLSSCIWFQSDVALGNQDVVTLIDRAMSAAVSRITDVYIQRRDIVSPFPGCPDSLETLINTISQLRECGWTSQVLIQPVHEMRSQLPDTVNGHPALRHTLPSDDLSFFGCLASASFHHRVHIAIKDETSLAMSDIWLLEEIINNTLDSFQRSVGECSKALLRIPVIDPAFESILSKVLIARSLQSPTYPTTIFRVMYHSSLLRCAMLQESLKPLMASTILEIVSELNLTPESEILLGELIAFLLHNNIVISNIDMIASRNHRVVIKTIEQLTRSTSSAQAKLPDQLHGLLPSEPEPPSFNIDSDQFTQLKQVVRIKDGSEVEVTQYLRTMEIPPEETTRMFLMVLVENGSRTITHFLKLLELYAPIVRTRPGAKEQLVDLLFQFWDPEKGHAQKLERYISITLGQTLVDPLVVAQRMDISNEDSITCYRLIDIVMKYAVQNSVAGDVADILLPKANDFMTKWIVKNWSTYIRPDSVELVKIF